MRRFVQNGSFGYRQSDDVVFQTLKARYSEAYNAFGEERRRETLERHKYSSYIERVGKSFYSEYREKWLRDLEELRKIMIIFKLGFAGFGMGVIFGKLKNKYLEAFEALEDELKSL